MRMYVNVFMFFKASLVFSQVNYQKENKEQSIHSSFVNTKAQFKGGFDSLMFYIQQNMVLPKEQHELNLYGHVKADFLITKNGKIQDVKIIESLHPICDSLVMGLINAMPNWEPALHGNIPIESRYTLPINFVKP